MAARRTRVRNTDARKVRHSEIAKLCGAGSVLLTCCVTAPRPVFPERFLFITRRCSQREFLLRPDDETNNAFTYLLAEAAERFGVVLILEQMMSNHHHTAIWDRLGHQVEFRE